MQFEPIEQWIWLPEEQYPKRQTTLHTTMYGDARKDGHYTAAEFSKTWKFDKPIASVQIRTSGDTFFRLYVNGQYILTGPASAGGDFLSNDRIRPQYYAYETTLDDIGINFSDGILAFRAVVRMMPLRMFEFSEGCGGFFLTAHVRFADGTKTVLLTDETWQAQLLTAHTAPGRYDARTAPEPPVNAARIRRPRHCLTAPIPPCAESELIPEGGDGIIVPAGGSVDLLLPLDMIYTGYPALSVKTSGVLHTEFQMTELGTSGSGESCTFVCDDSYIGTSLRSAGRIRIIAQNEGDKDAVIRAAFLLSHYPVTEEAITTTSDEEINLVLKVCSHTLKYCRQTLHLDSGSHCEPLACTGDYYIESLMTAFTFGDQRLSAFDVRRTAQLLRYNNGRMFHTTYSLIWVQMLWDVYVLTGEKELLSDCEDALILLLERFETYLGENGLIETPPDYMFIDWLIPDGISTHHPPKALGQTCLNLFYYGALRTAAKIYAILGDGTMSEKSDTAAETIRPVICTLLYDHEKGLFFEGLNTPTPEHLLYQYMPKNVEKRYYRKHANILAAYFGIFDRETCREILHKVMNTPELGTVQPYFMHFLLEAVYRNGLRDTYTRTILEEWKAPVRECPYGLAEGFYKPEPTYSFDHSHAWGGTPAYSLPLALTGLEILEPGFGKIRLDPSLLGLEKADVQIPTPRGMIEVHLEAGKDPVITVPDAIAVE